MDVHTFEDTDPTGEGFLNFEALTEEQEKRKKKDKKKRRRRTDNELCRRVRLRMARRVEAEKMSMEGKCSQFSSAFYQENSLTLTKGKTAKESTVDSRKCCASLLAGRMQRWGGGSELFFTYG